MKARVPLFCLNMEIVYTNTITHIDTCAADRVYNSPRWRQDPVQVLAGGTPANQKIHNDGSFYCDNVYDDDEES